MLILYGSQGGTSKEVAKLVENIFRNGYSDDFVCRIKEYYKAKSIMEMDEFDISKILDVRCIVFVCSTHGNGTEPFNMTRFWKGIKKLARLDIFSHLNFAVFGLGDSSYESYNYCSKKLYNLLISLGAKPLIRRGCGDAQDPEGWLQDFKPWIKELLLTNVIKTTELQNADAYKIMAQDLYDVTFGKKFILTPASYEPEIIEVEFDIKNYSTFKPGDCIGIRPTNCNMDDIVNYFGIDAQHMIDLDLNGIPHIIFFSFLYQYILTNDIECDNEKLTKIKELYKDYSLYYDYILKSRRTIFETFVELNLVPSVDFLKQFVPKISYRYFTLTKKGKSYFLIFSVVKYATSLKAPRKGLCSEYLRGNLTRSICKIGRSLINIKKCKVLVICTGAGISMANSLVNHYIDKSFIVYYGFRWYKKDCIDKDIVNKDNVKIYYTASRDDSKYVQDVYKSNPIRNIDEYDIVVSGNSRLNTIVNELFKEIYGKKIPFYCETW